MKIPDRIYLQVDPDGEGAFYQTDEITWCQDKINDNDVEYVRADLCQDTGGEGRKPPKTTQD